MADGSYILQFVKHGIRSLTKAGTSFIIQKQLQCHDGKSRLSLIAIFSRGTPLIGGCMANMRNAINSVRLSILCALPRSVEPTGNRNLFQRSQKMWKDNRQKM